MHQGQRTRQGYRSGRGADRAPRCGMRPDGDAPGGRRARGRRRPRADAASTPAASVAARVRARLRLRPVRVAGADRGSGPEWACASSGGQGRPSLRRSRRTCAGRPQSPPTRLWTRGACGSPRRRTTSPGSASARSPTRRRRDGGPPTHRAGQGVPRRFRGCVHRTVAQRMPRGRAVRRPRARPGRPRRKARRAQPHAAGLVRRWTQSVRSCDRDAPLPPTGGARRAGRQDAGRRVIPSGRRRPKRARSARPRR